MVCFHGLTSQVREGALKGCAPSSAKSKKMPLQELNFITGNKNKLTEVKAILDGLVPLKSQSLDLTEIQGTIEDVSKDKCSRAAAIVRLALLFYCDIF